MLGRSLRPLTLWELLCLALVLRLVGLLSQSLSMDECVELTIAKVSLSETIHYPNSFPPLYHLLLKAWTSISSSDAMLRVLPLMMGLSSILAIWYAVQDLADTGAARWATALATVSPFHVFYSQEGRSYMMYFLLAILAIWTGLRTARSSGQRDLGLFILVGSLGGYTHYYFAIVLIAVTIGGMAAYGTGCLPRFAWAALGIGLLCSPLLLLLPGDLSYQQHLREPRPMNVAAIGYSFFSFASGYSLGPSRNELHGMPAADAVRDVLGWIAAVMICYGIPALAGCWLLRKDRYGRVWLLLLLVPLLLIAIACSAAGLTYNPRFLVWLWFPFAILCAIGLNGLPTIVARGLLAGILAISAVAIVNRNFVDRYKNEDMRAAAQFLATQDAARPVVVCAGYMDGPLRHYLKTRQEIVELASGPEENLEQLEALLDRPLWLLYSRPFHGDPDGRLLHRAAGDAPKADFATAGIKIFSCGG